MNKGKTYRLTSTFFICLSMCFYCYGQTDDQKSILTDKGIFTVSQTAEGKDMIRFSLAVWDKMQQRTRFTAAHLNKMEAIRFCLEISSKNRSNCRYGIGFSCSVFDCPVKTEEVTVDRVNRICSVMLQKIDSNTVQLIFLDKVDWESLGTEF